MLDIIMAIENEEDRSYTLQVYDKYEKKIYNKALGILKDEHLASDCVHDVIGVVIDRLDIFKQLNEYQQVGFLMQTCENIIHNKYLYKGREYQSISTTYVDSSDDFDNLSDDDIPDICEECITKEMKEKLWKYVDMLDRENREIIIYRYALRMREKDIAKTIGMREDAIRQRISRAHKKLRKIGGKDLYE